MGVPKDTWVSYFIRGGEWSLPYPRSSEMIELWPHILGIKIHGGRDKPVRVGATTEKFTMREAWTWVLKRKEEVRWTRVVWHKHHVPKFSFTLWRALRGRLMTKCLMRQRGAKYDTTCVLCKTGVEDMTHLFWACDFTRQVWHQVRFGMPLHRTIKESLEAEAIGILGAHVTGLERDIMSLALSAVVHECWMERNTRIFEDEEKRSKEVAEIAKEAVRVMGVDIKAIKEDPDKLKIFEDFWRNSMSANNI